MPSAEQVLCGQPRELMLRFISELYSIFVVRPARGRLPAALAWLDRVLADAGRPLSPATLRPPHDRLGADLRGGAALALVLHAHLPPSRCAERRRCDGEPRRASSAARRSARVGRPRARTPARRAPPSSSRARGGRRPPPPPRPSTCARSARGRPSSGRRTPRWRCSKARTRRAAAAAGREQEHELCVVLAVALHARLAAVGAAPRPAAPLPR